MTNEEANEILGDVRAYLASRASLANESIAGHSFIDICNAIYALKAQPCEDCISREAVKALIKRLSFKYYMECGEYIGEDSREVTLINALKFEECFEDLPPVKPKYTDEEIDKAQAVEQAYVDKMVELAVEEIKERYSDAIGKMKKVIDEMTEIHSDGEFYIKNVDAKWIISKYLCGAEMSGGGEDEDGKSL